MSYLKSLDAWAIGFCLMLAIGIVMIIEGVVVGPLWRLWTGLALCLPMTALLGLVAFARFGKSGRE